MVCWGLRTEEAIVETGKNVRVIFGLVSAAILLLSHGLALGQLSPVTVAQNGWTDVYWGQVGNTNGGNVCDTGGTPGWTFNWTSKDANGNNVGDPNYATFTAGNGNYRFYIPREGSLQRSKMITDWEQKVGKSVVGGGNIQNGQPAGGGVIPADFSWSLQPLTDLPSTLFAIPDFATLLDSDSRLVYEAVDLATYYANNPLGPLGGNWSVGQTLDGLGLQIVNGQIPGVQGLYFATTDFTLDPLSATGWVPTGGSSAWLDSSTFESDGPLGIVAEHYDVPDPSTLAPFGFSALSLLAFRRARRHTAKA
jgi:hypothetical protein